MPETISISLATPLNSVELIDSFTIDNLSDETIEADKIAESLNEQLRAEQEKAFEFCQTLENVTKKLTSLYEKSISEQRQQIAQLCVEIAGKVLTQKIEDDDYKIETIVQEVLNSSPGGKEITIRLNPIDFEQCQKIQKEKNIFSDITFISDIEVGKAECVFESTKGNIESFIDSKLKQIAEELKKAV